MLLDTKSIVSDAQAITTTAISTNVVDLEVAGRDVFRGKTLYGVIQVHTTVTASTSKAATVAFQWEADSATGLSATPTVLASRAATGKATLVAGYRIVTPIPGDALVATDRYVGVRYTVATGPLTAGKFDAFLVEDYDQAKANV